jgi:hypothetical protein
LGRGGETNHPLLYSKRVFSFLESALEFLLAQKF